MLKINVVLAQGHGLKDNPISLKKLRAKQLNPCFNLKLCRNPHSSFDFNWKIC